MLFKILISTVLFSSVLLISTQRSDAVNLDKTTIGCSCMKSITTKANGDKIETITYAVEPVNVESFQFDFNFNPIEEQFFSLNFVQPYTPLQPPDFSQLSAGKILDIAGTTSTIPLGNVNLVELIFIPLVSNPTLPTVSLSSNDYVTVLNTNTGQTTTLTSNDLSPAKCQPVPEPTSTLSLLALCTLGTASTLKRKLKTFKSLEKKTEKVS